MQSKRGFSVIEAVVLLAVVIVIGGVGYMAYTNFVVNKSKSDTKAAVASTDSSAPVKVTSTADLDSVSKELDSMSIEDSSSSSQYNSASSSF